MVRSSLRNVAVTVVLSFTTLTRVAFADSGAVNLPNPLGDSCKDLTCPLNTVIDFLYTIAIPLCAIMIIVGGFQMVTAAGDPEKFSKGRKTILYAVAGFAVILVAGGVSSLITKFLSP